MDGTLPRASAGRLWGAACIVAAALAATTSSAAGATSTTGARSATGAHTTAGTHSAGVGDSVAPELAWERLLASGGNNHTLRAIAIEGNRVFVAGDVGSWAGSGPRDTAVYALRLANGATDWSRVFGASDTHGYLRAMAATSNTLYVAGFADHADSSRTSFVLALRTSDGSTRWLHESATGGDNEWFEGVTVADDRVFVVGRRDRHLLVRAYRANSGALLWEDDVDGLSFDRVTHARVAGNRLYAFGDRDIAIGRSAVLVARAYDAASGALAWETAFGDAIGPAAPVAMADGRFFVGGNAYEIGSGIFRTSVYAIDRQGGAVVWDDRVYRSFDTASESSALIAADGTVFVGGTVYRQHTAPTFTGYATDGTRLWRHDHDLVARSGRINALAAVDGTVLATGSGGRRRHSPAQDLLLQGYDSASGAVQWSLLRANGVADSEGTAIAADGDRFTIGGTYEPTAGSPAWMVQLYQR